MMNFSVALLSPHWTDEAASFYDPSFLFLLLFVLTFFHRLALIRIAVQEDVFRTFFAKRYVFKFVILTRALVPW